MYIVGIFCWSCEISKEQNLQDQKKSKITQLFHAARGSNGFRGNFFTFGRRRACAIPSRRRYSIVVNCRSGRDVTVPQAWYYYRGYRSNIARTCVIFVDRVNGYSPKSPGQWRNGVGRTCAADVLSINTQVVFIFREIAVLTSNILRRIGGLDTVVQRLFSREN